MEELLKWLSVYSLPIVVLILLGAVFIYFIKIITEKTISNEFDKRKKGIELELERRSNFEEKILIDRYIVIREIRSKLNSIMSNLNRLRSGTIIEGFIVNGDIVPLTEVFEQISLNKYLITEKVHENLWKQGQLAIQFANKKNQQQMVELESNYLELQESLNTQMNNMFGLENIKW